MPVVDEHQQPELVVRVGGQQAEGRRSDSEAVPGMGWPQGERALERLRLGAGDRGQAAQRRAQQLQQAGERDASLGPHAPRPQHLHAARLLLGVAEQGGLADPGLANHGKDAAAAGPGILEQPGDRPQLTVAPAQHGPECRAATRCEARNLSARTRVPPRSGGPAQRPTVRETSRPEEDQWPQSNSRPPWTATS